MKGKFKYESRDLMCRSVLFQPSSSRPFYTHFLATCRGGQAGRYLATPGTVHESQVNDGTNRTHEWIATQGVGPSPCEEGKRASNLKRSTQKRKGKKKKKKKGVHALCPACLLAPKGSCLDRVSFCFCHESGKASHHTFSMCQGILEMFPPLLPQPPLESVSPMHPFCSAELDSTLVNWIPMP